MIFFCMVMLLTSSVIYQYNDTTHIKILGVRVYTINGHIARKKLDDRSHHDYFMGYETTTEIIIYWNTEIFPIYRSHHDYFMIIILAYA